jgi:hypothetical protein
LIHRCISFRSESRIQNYFGYLLLHLITLISSDIGIWGLGFGIYNLRYFLLPVFAPMQSMSIGNIPLA